MKMKVASWWKSLSSVEKDMLITFLYDIDLAIFDIKVDDKTGKYERRKR